MFLRYFFSLQTFLFFFCEFRYFDSLAPDDPIKIARLASLAAAAEVSNAVKGVKGVELPATATPSSSSSRSSPSSLTSSFSRSSLPSSSSPSSLPPPKPEKKDQKLADDEILGAIKSSVEAVVVKTQEDGFAVKQECNLGLPSNAFTNNGGDVSAEDLERQVNLGLLKAAESGMASKKEPCLQQMEEQKTEQI